MENCSIFIDDRISEAQEIIYEGKVYTLDWEGNVDDLPGHFFRVVEGQGVVYNCDRPAGKAYLTKAIKVHVHFDESPKTYEAWSFLEDWNGWACPFFERHVAEEVAKDNDGEYHAKTDSFNLNEGPEENYESRYIETVDGRRKVYPIGHSGWTWTLVENVHTESVYDDL